MNRFTYDQVVSSKIPSSYPNYVLDNIQLLSIDKNKSTLVGSFSFSLPQFPSDIDVREVIDEGTTYEGVIRFFINGIRAKVLEIQQKPFYWVTEVKIGYDPRFNFSVVDPDVLFMIQNLMDNNLINESELDILTSGDNEAADFLLQDHAKLRWSVSDLLNGYKMLPGNEIIYLEEAIPQKGVINMEVIGYSNNKFMDLSNFFALVYYDMDGTLKSINLPDQSISDFDTFFTNEVKSNIKKLYYSKIAPDYAKMIKRYFSLGRFVGDEQLVSKVYPYLNSVTALAGQKKSEIALLIKLIQFTGLVGVPQSLLINQLSNIKLSLAAIIDLDRDILLNINNLLDKVMYEPSDANLMVENLNKVKKILATYVSNHALDYLKEVGLAPPPKKYIN
jgi:hypothetical protein